MKFVFDVHTQRTNADEINPTPLECNEQHMLLFSGKVPFNIPSRKKI
jgi:hypothetical protein